MRDTKTLTETNQLKIAYNRMYQVLSDYIWNMDVVEALVNVEVETYKTFPDIGELKRLINILRNLMRSVVGYNEKRVSRAISRFESAVDDVNELYAIVKYPKEVSSV